jgi:hypothetical protein
MKTLLIIIGLLSYNTLAIAAPFLVCDPQEGVETYEVYQNGGLIAGNIPSQADGSLKYDMAEITPGSYEFNAKACSVWGCSELSADPTQSPAPSQPPTGLGMTR